MTTEHHTSGDGLRWTRRARALAPRVGRWNARGVRVSAVFTVDGRWAATYDGRATAGENWEERTGLAHATATPGGVRGAGLRSGGPVAARRPGSSLPERGRPARGRLPPLLRRPPAPTGRTTCAPSCCCRRSGRWGTGPRRPDDGAGRLLDFLLLGAPKCGTSARHAALARRPALCLSDPKEPKYFLTMPRPPTCGAVPATWPPGPSTCGAATTTRPCSPRPPTRPGAPRSSAASKTGLPHARLVAVLRDPVERAHSNWAHARSGVGAGGRFPLRTGREEGGLGAALRGGHRPGRALTGWDLAGWRS
jgi:hypothetical protein